MRPHRLTALAPMVVAAALAAPAAAAAGPCDDARDAWLLVSRAADALDAGRDADATRLVGALVAPGCAPPGDGREAIERARQEARLVRLQSLARAQRALLRRRPRTPPSTRAFAAWLRDARAGLLDRLTPAAQEILRGGAAAPSAQRDAALVLADAYADFVLALSEAPLPPALASSRELVEAYRDTLRSHTEPLMAVAHQARETAARRMGDAAYEPPGVRRATALLAAPPPLPPATAAAPATPARPAPRGPR